MIYQWPGCPYYDAISERNRVEFPNAQAAEAAISAGKELPMNTRERSLKERCAKFGAIISRLDRRAFTNRQRQVAELRTAGLSLQEIAERLGVSRERVR